MIKVICDCGVSLKVEVDHAIRKLKAGRNFGFGQHVADPRAFVMRWLNASAGWIYVGGRIGKTTITMTCPACREQPLELPVDPEDLRKQPASFQ